MPISIIDGWEISIRHCEYSSKAIWKSFIIDGYKYQNISDYNV